MFLRAGFLPQIQAAEAAAVAWQRTVRRRQQELAEFEQKIEGLEHGQVWCRTPLVVLFCF